MEQLDIKIGNNKYIMRNEFSKVIVFNDNGSKRTYDGFNDLPEEEQQLIKDALKIKENPGLYFELDEIAIINNPSSITISKYIGNDIKNVVIPSEINGVPVSIKGKIFYNNENVEAIYLPEKIFKIDDYFCTDMPDLKKVHISPNIACIPENCFFRCQLLDEINTENITTIKDKGFHSCESLKKLNLENLEYIGYAGFSYCTSLQSIYAPKVDLLGDFAFNHCESLETAEFSDNLEVIGECAFTYCASLKNIKLPEKLFRINMEAFLCCEELKAITFPDSLKYIGKSAFKKSGLEGAITFPQNLKIIQTWAFEDTNISGINISKNTEYEQSSFPLDALLNINEYDSIKTKLKNIFKDKER